MELSRHDKETIVNYINSFAGLGANELYEESCSIENLDHILRYWRENKCSLFKLLGNNLIISKDIDTILPISALTDEMWKRIRNNTKALRFFRKWEGFVTGLTFTNQDIDRNYWELVKKRNIAKNVYEGDTFHITKEDGKKVKIQNGMKFMKVLKIFNDIYDFAAKEEFEEFRLVHSQALTAAKVSGTLSLSIHPLDYLTMSDNDNDWHSCMSWTNAGEYRIGTVEMMNSPYVVIAYFTTKDNNEFYFNNTGIWNNKIWRCLYIVDPQAMIAEIRQYPYESEILNGAALTWLRELAAANLATSYSSIPTTLDCTRDMFTPRDVIHPLTGEHLNIKFITQYMYNDFRHMHEAYFVENWTFGSLLYCIDYSGTAICMCCGEDFYPEECEEVVCCHCDSSKRCAECGSVYLSDEMEYIDGCWFCPDCREQYIDECDICGKQYYSCANGYTYSVYDDNTDYSIGGIHLCEECVMHKLNRVFIKPPEVCCDVSSSLLTERGKQILNYTG